MISNDQDNRKGYHGHASFTARSLGPVFTCACWGADGRSDRSAAWREGQQPFDADAEAIIQPFEKVHHGRRPAVDRRVEAVLLVEHQQGIDFLLTRINPVRLEQLGQLRDEQGDLAGVAGPRQQRHLLLQQVVANLLHDPDHLTPAAGGDLGRLTAGLRGDGHLRLIFELLELNPDLLDPPLAGTLGLRNGAVGLQLGPAHLGLLLPPVKLNFLLRRQDALVGPVLSHQHPPVGVRFGTLGPGAQPCLFDFDILPLAREGLVGQVGDVVRGVPDALERHRNHLHAERAQIGLAVLEQHLAEDGALAFALCGGGQAEPLGLGGGGACSGDIFRAFLHADGLERRRLVQRRSEVADHGLLDLLLDLLAGLAQQLLHRAVEQRLVHVVHADTRGGVRAHVDAVGRVHAFDAHVDRQDREVDGLRGLDERDDHRPAALLDAEAVLAAIDLGLGPAGDHQDVVRRTDPDQGAEHAQDQDEDGQSQDARDQAENDTVQVRHAISLLSAWVHRITARKRIRRSPRRPSPDLRS